MNIIKRANCYVIRKKGKSILLLCILLLASLLFLSSFSIMEVTKQLRQDIEKKSNTKLRMTQTEESTPISEEIVEQVTNLKNIARYNRVSVMNAVPAAFQNIKGAPQETKEDEMVQFHGYDNIEEEGPFLNQLLKLLEGTLWDEKGKESLLIHRDLAAENGLNVGDNIQLEGENGQQVQGRISGIYTLVDSSPIDKDNDVVSALFRPENQIYGTQDVVKQLQTNPGYEEVFFYLKNPALAKEDVEEISEMIKASYNITINDNEYVKMKGSLEQTKSIISLMLGITVFTAGTVITLILSLWVRSRMKEVAVFISLGEYKRSIFSQFLLEVWIILGCAEVIAVILSSQVVKWMADAMLNIPDANMEGAVSISGIVWLMVGGMGITAAAVLISMVPVFTINPRNILAMSE